MLPCGCSDDLEHCADTGSTVVTVMGRDMGRVDYSGRVRMGGSAAVSTTSWSSDSSIGSKMSEGRGFSLTTAVTVLRTATPGGVSSLTPRSCYHVAAVAISSSVRTPDQQW